MHVVQRLIAIIFIVIPIMGSL